MVALSGGVAHMDTSLILISSVFPAGKLHSILAGNSAAS